METPLDTCQAYQTKDLQFGPISVQGHIEYINGIQLGLSLNIEQIRNSSVKVLAEKNRILDCV